MATYIPVIGLLYLFLSALEDSADMARAAFVMERFMRWVGLPGKSFVPTVLVLNVLNAVGTAGAFAYLLFILLCFPCTAAIAAVVQAGWRP